MSRMVAVMKRELTAYFQTPVAYVFMVVFLISAGAFTFSLSDYFTRGVADLQPFFMWHPWLYLFLVPAISMRLWAEERKSGTIELLMTLPVRTRELVLGKFLAAWVFIILTLCATAPLWITVNYLGDPDNGVILASYIGSALMAGAYLAIGSAVSACTNNQVIAFVVTAALCLVFAMMGFSLIVNFVEGWLPEAVVTMLHSLSVLTHYQDITKGILPIKSLIYFFSMMIFWLYATHHIIHAVKGAK
jgi:ABC-2 type transport system permease protein